MDPRRIDEAVKEARRFLKRVEELKKSRRENWTNTYYLWGSKYTAAVRRASLDLTRALAKMRKSPRGEGER